MNSETGGPISLTCNRSPLKRGLGQFARGIAHLRVTPRAYYSFEIDWSNIGPKVWE
jgi:hypothetical protein